MNEKEERKQLHEEIAWKLPPQDDEKIELSPKKVDNLDNFKPPISDSTYDQSRFQPPTNVKVSYIPPSAQPSAPEFNPIPTQYMPSNSQNGRQIYDGNPPMSPPNTFHGSTLSSSAYDVNSFRNNPPSSTYAPSNPYPPQNYATAQGNPPFFGNSAPYPGSPSSFVPPPTNPYGMYPYPQHPPYGGPVPNLGPHPGYTQPGNMIQEFLKNK
jgi:hypothetical protein